MEKPEPCPFCGETPKLPEQDEIGTWYEFECDCGMAMSRVQICDLMTIDERIKRPFNIRAMSYEEEFVARAKKEAIKKWNTRKGSK